MFTSIFFRKLTAQYGIHVQQLKIIYLGPNFLPRSHWKLMSILNWWLFNLILKLTTSVMRATLSPNLDLLSEDSFKVFFHPLEILTYTLIWKPLPRMLRLELTRPELTRSTMSHVILNDDWTSSSLVSTRFIQIIETTGHVRHPLWLVEY